MNILFKASKAIELASEKIADTQINKCGLLKLSYKTFQ